MNSLWINQEIVLFLLKVNEPYIFSLLYIWRKYINVYHKQYPTLNFCNSYDYLIVASFGNLYYFNHSSKHIIFSGILCSPKIVIYFVNLFKRIILLKLVKKKKLTYQIFRIFFSQILRVHKRNLHLERFYTWNIIVLCDFLYEI